MTIKPIPIILRTIVIYRVRVRVSGISKETDITHQNTAYMTRPQTYPQCQHATRPDLGRIVENFDIQIK